MISDNYPAADGAIPHEMLVRAYNDLRADVAKLEAELESRESVVWMHVLDNTEGYAENDPIVRFSFSDQHPFGTPGKDFSAQFPIESVPLYR